MSISTDWGDKNHIIILPSQPSRARAREELVRGPACRWLAGRRGRRRAAEVFISGQLEN
nr:unnamed protein product [Digitaria exilis]